MYLCLESLKIYFKLEDVLFDKAIVTNNCWDFEPTYLLQMLSLELVNIRGVLEVVFVAIFVMYFDLVCVNYKEIGP